MSATTFWDFKRRANCLSTSMCDTCNNLLKDINFSYRRHEISKGEYEALRMMLNDSQGT